MSDTTRHCYQCLAKVEARATPTGWLHCPRCGANIGFDPPAAPPAALAMVSPYVYEKPIGYLFGSPEDPCTPVSNPPEAHGYWPEKFDGPVRHTVESYDPATKSATVTNPKTLMGRQKLSILSVVPPASIICEAEAMHYGAFEAPRKDGKKGYGPFNWRDDPVELMIYLDAAARHILAYIDGEECAPDSLASHLGHAKACLGIIADAKANGTLIDDRPKVRKGAAATMLSEWKQIHAIHTGEPT
jgi:hypothetical protein